MGGPPQMHYRPQQAMQGKFPSVSGPSPSQGAYSYLSKTVYSTGQPSSPVHIVRAPTAPMTGMPQFQTQNFEPHQRERKIIQVTDPNSNKDVTQEILNRQPSGSLTGSTGGTNNNSNLDISEQSACLRTPLTSRQQAEAHVRALFAAQVAATLANDSREKQYRLDQAQQNQFTPVSGSSKSQPQTTVYPMGMCSPPYNLVRALTAPMTEVPQFQTQPFEPRERERKIIQIKDPNSNKAVTQESLNRPPSGSLTGSTSGTTSNSNPDTSEQSASSRTPVTSQQQAEANVRAQFAAQVAATLANDNQEKQYRLEQATQSHFTPLSGSFKSQPQTTVNPMGQPSPPYNVVRALTAPMTEMPLFQNQDVEPHARERKIIQIKEPNSNKAVTQESLTRPPSGSLTDSTSGTISNSNPDTSEQSASSRTPLTSQQQAEANVRAQFAAQVAATLANNNQEKQYRLEQATQSHFTPMSGSFKSQPQTTFYPMGQPSPPYNVVRALTAPTTEMPQFQTQPFEPRERERKIIQIKDPNSNKAVTQESLNRPPSGSLTGSTSGTTSNSNPDTSEQPASSRTPVTSQQQAEANVRAQFAAQVAATLANDNQEKQYRLEQATQSQFTPVSGSFKSQPQTSREKEYRLDQAQQNQFTPVSGSSKSQPQTTVYPMGMRSPPYNLVRALTAPMTEMPLFQNQDDEPHARERKIIRIKDPNSNKAVTQESLNRPPSGSLTGSTSCTTSNSNPDTSEQSASSSTPLTSQQQAEANVRAQFAAQVAATLANDNQEKQYRLEQATQSQFTPVSGSFKSQPQTTFYPMGQPSPPYNVVRALTAPMTEMPQFQTQNVESHAQERKVIQIKDPYSNKAVTQESLNRPPSGSLTGSTSCTTRNSNPDTSEQSASSRTPLTSQQQAEANVRAQFAAQVAATLANNNQEKQYRLDQAKQNQFTPMSGSSKSQLQTTLFPMIQPSPPYNLVRALTAPMTKMPQCQTQPFEPRERERKIIQVKDPNSNKAVTQESLNRPPLGSLTGSTSGTTSNSNPDTSEQSASSRTPVTSQQQAEANVRAQFAAQVAATLANDNQEKQYRLDQAKQNQFTPISGSSKSQPQTTVNPMGQRSPPYNVVRALTAPMTEMPQFQTQNVESYARERKVIQIKDPYSTNDVTQESLNLEPSGSLTGSTSGTTSNSNLDISEQSASSRTPVTSQQQAEGNFRALFAAQVAATLANDNQEKQYRLDQAKQNQFTPVSGSSKSQPQTTVFPMRQPSPPYNLVRALTAPMTEMPLFRTQDVEPHARERKIIQIKDPNSNKAVTQESLNRPLSGSLIGSTSGTTSNSNPDNSEQSASSRTPLTSQQQAEANVRALFAAQVAATLANNQEKQYRLEQAKQNQFTSVSGSSKSQPQTTVNPMGQPSPPYNVVRVLTAPMTEMPQFQTQPFEPPERERKVIQIKDPNSNKIVTQEILNCQPSGSLTGSASGTTSNSNPDTSEQSASSRTPLTSQQQAEARVRALFAAQVAATLASDSQEKQYRLDQATQSQFTTVSGSPKSQPETTVNPIGQRSPPYNVVRVLTAPMTEMPLFQTQTFEPLALERKIIQIKDPNSNKDVTQEILNRPPSGSLTGSTSCTTSNSNPDA